MYHKKESLAMVGPWNINVLEKRLILSLKRERKIKQEREWEYDMMKEGAEGYFIHYPKQWTAYSG